MRRRARFSASAEQLCGSRSGAPPNRPETPSGYAGGAGLGADVSQPRKGRDEDAVFPAEDGSSRPGVRAPNVRSARSLFWLLDVIYCKSELRTGSRRGCGPTCAPPGCAAPAQSSRERHQLVGHQVDEQVRHRAVQALEGEPERVLTPLSGRKAAMKLWRR